MREGTNAADAGWCVPTRDARFQAQIQKALNADILRREILRPGREESLGGVTTSRIECRARCKTNARNRFCLTSPIVDRLSGLARTMPRRSPLRSVTPALSIAVSVPVPIAIPTWTRASAGASAPHRGRVPAACGKSSTSRVRTSAPFSFPRAFLRIQHGTTLALLVAGRCATQRPC